jgi:hypothetical protein
MPVKIALSTIEAKRKWGDDIYVRLAGGQKTFREFIGEGGVWKPVFDQAHIWTGYRLTKVDYDVKRRPWRRR